MLRRPSDCVKTSEWLLALFGNTTSGVFLLTMSSMLDMLEDDACEKGDPLLRGFDPRLFDDEYTGQGLCGRSGIFSSSFASLTLGMDN